jgi:CheY-like chemotaxis protein
MTPPAHILIVEDERLVALTLAHRLRQLGYTIAGLATSGTDAVMQALAHHPDLVLMDLRLPGTVDGLEAAQFLCTHLNLPVLVITGATQEAIAAALHIGRATVVRICRRFIEEGLEAALRDRSRPGAQRKLDGKQEAFLMALLCSPPPAGRQCWTMPLLANQLVERRVVEAISDETVRRTLKNTS